jgi:5-formyltetrahydrofolate cyclo-ligase
MTDKKELRKRCLQKRDSLSAEDREAFSLRICERIVPYIKDKTILSYAPVSSEVDLTMINETYPVAYPVIRQGQQMDAYIPEQGKFITDRYGIREPDPACSRRIEKEEIEVILVPCVGFNKKKDRLGHGGGYYDRYLKDCKALKIGIAFEAQKTEADLKEENDITLDMIITEKDVY